MTRHSILAGAFCALLLPLGACHKDDPTPDAVKSKVYSGMNALELSYNGSGMAGKRVSLNAEGSPATITLDGVFDLSTLSSSLQGVPPLAAPGVIPGSTSLKLDISPYPSDGKWAFSGNGETDHATFSYSGRYDAEKMTLDLTDVLLKDRSMVSVWKPAPVKKSPDLLTYESQPIHIVWETQLPIPIPGLEKEPGELIDLLVNIPFIPVYNNTASMSLTQVVANGLRAASFNPDGNLAVTYLQTADGASTFAQAPLCTFQYIPAGKEMVLLYVNPTDILTLVLLNNTNKSPDIPEHPFGLAPRADESGSLLATLPAETQGLILKTIVALANQCAAGMPMHAVKDAAGGMAFYVGMDVLGPLMTNTVLPLLSDPAIQQLISAYIASNEALAPHAAEIALLMDSLPLLMMQTTDIQIGLNLVPYTE